MLPGSPLTVERGGSQTNSLVVCVLPRLTNTNVTCNIVFERERGSFQSRDGRPSPTRAAIQQGFPACRQITAVVYPVGRKTLLDFSSRRTGSATSKRKSPMSSVSMSDSGEHD